MKELDTLFVTTLNRTLNPNGTYFVCQKIYMISSEDDSDQEVVATIYGTRIKRSVIKQFGFARPLNMHAITAIMSLFNKRDERIVRSYYDVNGQKLGLCN